MLAKNGKEEEGVGFVNIEQPLYHNSIGPTAPVEQRYVITNNHYEGKAVANALMLKSMVSGQRVPSPSAVYETYRDVLEAFAEPEDQFAGGTASLLTARR